MKRNRELESICRLNSLGSRWPSRYNTKRTPNWKGIVSDLIGVQEDNEFYGRVDPKLANAIEYAKANYLSFAICNLCQRLR